MIDSSAIRERFAALSRHLSERDRRLWAASEARAAGYGGIAAVSAATGIAASTIGRGLKELASADTLDVGRVRRRGGGRQPLVKKDATLLADLLALVDPSERGDPMSPLRWTCKSLSQLAAALAAKGHRVGRTVVGELLHQQKFSLLANRKTREGDSHPDRDAQFVHINDTVAAALAAGEPVISVDTKKKELVGDFKNAGREWRPAGQPQDVRVQSSFTLAGSFTPWLALSVRRPVRHSFRIRCAARRNPSPRTGRKTKTTDCNSHLHSIHTIDIVVLVAISHVHDFVIYCT